MSITCSSCIVGLVFCFYSIWALSFVPVGCVGLVFRVCWLWVLFTISPIKITSFFYCTCGQWDTFTSGPIKKNLLSLWAFCLLDRCDVRHHITSIYYSKLSDTPQKKKSKLSDSTNSSGSSWTSSQLPRRPDCSSKQKKKMIDIFNKICF